MSKAAFWVSLGLAAMTLGAIASVVAQPFHGRDPLPANTGKIPLLAIQPSVTTLTPSTDAANVDISLDFSAGQITPTTAGTTPAGTSPVLTLPIETTIAAGSVVVQSNSVTGYTVQVQSNNGAAMGTSTGVLISREAGNRNAIIYTVSLGSQKVSFSNGVGTWVNATGPTPAGGIKLPVMVTVRLSPFLQAGAYSDVLSFITKGK